jgi:ligand-binding sensor domain-containing protein
MVRGIDADHLGNTWFATWDGIAVHTANGQWACFTPANSGLGHVYCWDIAVDSGGRVWVSHYVEQGVSLLDPNGTPTNLADDSWLTFTAADGLDGSHGVYTVEIGPFDHPWFGHDEGINRLMHNGTPFYKDDDIWFSHWHATMGTNGGINAILFDSHHDVWAASDYGLSRLSDAAWSKMSEPYDPWTWDLAEDHNGHIWAVGSSLWMPVWEWDGSQWHKYDHDNTPLPDEPVQAVHVDHYNNKWFGLNQSVSPDCQGIARLDPQGDWTVELSHNCVEAIDFDTAGVGWFGGEGVSEYHMPGSSGGAVTPGSGGSVTSPDGLAKASFPAGAVGADTVVTLTVTHSPPTGDLLGVYFYDLSAVVSGTTTPVTEITGDYTVNFVYTDQVRKAAVEDTMDLWWWNESSSAWSQAGITSTLSTTYKALTSTVNHLSEFAILGETNAVYLPTLLKKN